METVKAFNNELSALYEVKPPISKAKMTSITKSAIKAIKFYKHVVQSVEKFILKCKPEYKIPGLYVIDSIVRQSRHQFGTDKDVFAPRFAKNILQTFVNIYKCPPEDKSRIIRVLNLWQKNQVFAPDVVQPLFDLADPNHPIYKELGTPVQSNGVNAQLAGMQKGSPAIQKTPTKTAQGYESVQGGSNLNLADQNVLLQLQQLQRLMNRGEAKPEGPVHFDKKLLDFDYGDDEEENPSPKNAPNVPNDSVTNLLTNPEVLRQLQTLQQTMALAQDAMQDPDKLRKLQEMKLQEDEFDKHLAQTVPNLPFAAECEFKPPGPPSNAPGYYLQSVPDTSQPPPSFKNQHYDPGPEAASSNQDRPGKDGEIEVITLDHGDSRSPSPREDRYSSRRRRSRSRSRERRDRRSRRSRSRSRRRRSRSREHREKDRDKKEKETEKDRERKKRGLPTIKADNLSVCSTTLWVGHLSKLVHQDDLSNTFGEYGDIVSIDLIPPRGCAFIVMHRRQDAARCLVKLKNHIIHGKAITLAWAPGKGVKGKDLKDYWEGDLGVSYIPWSKLKPDMDLELLEDGGMIDEDTMPQWMKEKVSGNEAQKAAQAQQIGIPIMDNKMVDTSQPPPMAGGLLQPPMSMPMPFQFNNRLLAPPNMMNLPPGMMAGMPPMGVPPPNLQPQILTNSMLGMGSPFQGPAALLPPPPMALPNEANADNGMKSLADGLINLSQTFGAPPGHFGPAEDNMDVEMELDDKNERDNKLGAERDDSRSRDRRDRHRDAERDRDRRGRSRDRERDRDRNRDRDRRSGDRSRDWDRDRDRKNDRDRGRERRDDRRDERRDRDRGNRWNDRERGARDAPEERRDRERTLNERLQEMANMGTIRNPRDAKDAPSSSAYNNVPPPTEPPPSFNNGMDAKFESAENSIKIIDEEIKPELELSFEAPIVGDETYPPVVEPIDSLVPMGEIHMDNYPPEYIEDDGYPMGPRDDFYPGGPRGNFRRGPNFGDPMDFPGEVIDDFARGPMGEFAPVDEFGPFRRHEPGFRGRGRGFRGGPPRGAHHGPEPEFFDPRDGFGPPRDAFGPPVRGGFGPRGRGLRHPGPPGKFFRGGPRGRGTGPWNDRNFNPRFDGPPGGPDFFRGPPGVDDDEFAGRPRRPFGDRRRDERRPSFEGKETADADDAERPGRKSRWGENDRPEEASNEPAPNEGVAEAPEGADEPGNQTPLHDEGPPGVDFAPEGGAGDETQDEAADETSQVEAEA